MNNNDFPISDLFDDIPRHLLDAALIRGAIAAAIINKRHDLGLTQKEFAKKYKVSQGMVSKWESAEYNFTISNLTELMSILEIPFDILLNGERAIEPTRAEYKNLMQITQDWNGSYTKLSLTHFSSIGGAA